MVSSVRFIFLQVFQHFNKEGIVLRHHDAEPYKFSIQALEGGTVTDYQALADAGFKNIIRGKAWFQDLKKNEVCIGGIDLISWNGLQFFDHSCALRKDQFTGLADIVFILEHDLAGRRIPGAAKNFDTPRRTIRLVNSRVRGTAVMALISGANST